MTFLHGWRLVALLGPLGLAAGYLVVQRRRHSQVLRFTSVDLLDSVAPPRQAWKRHVPAAALLGALVVLTMAFAQPALAYSSAKPGTTIVLTIDVSGSMTSTDVSPTRLQAAQKQASAFVAGLPHGVQVGLVAFSDQASVLVPPTTDTSSVLQGISSLTAGGGTATAAGISTALAAVESSARPGVKLHGLVVLMSDGAPNIGTPATADPIAAAVQAADAAKAVGVPVDTIAYGTQTGTVTIEGQLLPVPSDPGTMATLAQASGGRSWVAQSGSQLGAIYRQISATVAFKRTTHDLTAPFAGLALLAALGAGAAALVWGQRLL